MSKTKRIINNFIKNNKYNLKTLLYELKIKNIEKKNPNFNNFLINPIIIDLISIIIVTYNNERTIESVLKSIFNSHIKNYEIILVDNNSHDKTIEKVKKFKNSNLKTFFLKKNIGFAKGNNFGVEQSSGKMIMFLNPDAVLQKDTIDGLYHTYLKLNKKYQKIILSPKIKVLSKGRRIFKIGTINSMGFAFFDHIEPSKLKIVQETDFVSGCCMFMRTQDFKNLKFFNPTYFMYYEDVEFSIRARLNGFRLFVINKFAVTHLKTDLDYKLNKFKYYFVERNRIKTLIQYNYNKKKIIFKLFLFEPIMIFHAIINGFLSTRVSIYSYFLKTKYIDDARYIKIIENLKTQIKISNNTNAKALSFFSRQSQRYQLLFIILELFLKILNKF